MPNMAKTQIFRKKDDDSDIDQVVLSILFPAGSVYNVASNPKSFAIRPDIKEKFVGENGNEFNNGSLIRKIETKRDGQDSIFQYVLQLNEDAVKYITHGWEIQNPSTKKMENYNPFNGKLVFGRFEKGRKLQDYAHILFLFPTMSERHFELEAPRPEYNNRNWDISDLGSTNGTYINGAQITGRYDRPLEFGDVIKVGKENSLMLPVVKYHPKTKIIESACPAKSK